MPANYPELQKRFWEAADELRINSNLKPLEYFVQSRDWLLSKLISGELDVENLNINTENIAA
jgi:hypothetical protein